MNGLASGAAQTNQNGAVARVRLNLHRVQQGVVGGMDLICGQQLAQILQIIVVNMFHRASLLFLYIRIFENTHIHGIAAFYLKTMVRVSSVPNWPGAFSTNLTVPLT